LCSYKHIHDEGSSCENFTSSRQPEVDAYIISQHCQRPDRCIVISPTDFLGICMILNKSSSSHLGREWTHVLCVLAVQCPLQTSPITQPLGRHTLQYRCHLRKPTRCKVPVTCDFFLKSLIHFRKFLINANFDFATKYTFKTSIDNESIAILSVRKYC